MKKILIAIAVVATISGCQSISEKFSTYEIIYGKDTATHLCFGYLKLKSKTKDAGSVTYFDTQTCVPCDSLKNVKVFIIGQETP